MMLRSYVISGIKPEMAKSWYKEFKDVAKFSRNTKTGDYSMKMTLPLLDAIKVKVGMIGYNFSHKCKLKINRYKGRRFRV